MHFRNQTQSRLRVSNVGSFGPRHNGRAFPFTWLQLRPVILSDGDSRNVRARNPVRIAPARLCGQC